MIRAEISMRSRASVYILLLCSLVPIAAGLRVDHRLLGDDPLITLTYAKNIADGNGFVFNHGDPVLGTTAPLFALAVAAGMVVLPGVAGTAIAVWITVFCWLGLIWIFYLLREPLGLPKGAAVWAGAAMAAGGWISHLGMEAYPFALLLVATVAASFARRWLPLGVLGGLLFLTRGEGILLFGLAVVAGWYVSHREGKRPSSLMSFPPFLSGVGFLIPLALWSAYAVPVFGNIFPNTLAAKIAQVDSGLWPSFQARLAGSWVPGWSLGPSAGFALLNLTYVLAVAGLVRVVRAYPRLLVFVAWAVAYAAGYSLLGVPGYPWYRLPIEFVLLLLIALALHWIACAIRTAEAGAVRRIGALVPGVAILVWLFAPTFEALREPPVLEKDRAYRAMAGWFAENGTPGERIAYMEIGYIGYYTELGIVDLVGLVTPEITPRVAARDFTSGFWELRPEYLVSLEQSRFILPILNNPDFVLEYEKAADLEGFDGLGLTIFRRRAS